MSRIASWTLAATIVIAAPDGARGQDAAKALQEELRAIADRSSAAVVALLTPGIGGSENPFDAQARASGFIFSPEGHILTDARAVRGRRRFDVRLRGGLRGTARVVGTDTLNSTAVLLLEDAPTLAARFGGKLPTVPLGSSADLRLGQSVFTVTNAFDSLSSDGLPSFSWGNVTSVGRARQGEYRGVAIEIDAAVNPGSFGAPLLDRAGRVVGIVSMSFSTGRWLGMAIPIDQVRLGVEDVLAGRSLTQGFLGLAVRSTGGEAKSDGVEVLRVADGSPAAKAGLQPGDRLLAIDGATVFEPDDIGRELMPLAPGSRVALRVRRGDGARDVKVVLGRGEAPVVVQRPAETARPAARPAQPPQPPAPRQDTTPPAPEAPRVTLGVRTSNRPNGGGVQVVEVQPDSPAARAGVAAGDVILALGKDKVGSLIDLRRLLDTRKPGDSVTLTIERDGWSAQRTVVLGGVGASNEAAPAKGPGYLGVYLKPGTLEVERCEAGSPAAKADLRPGDRLAGVGDRPLHGAQDLAAALQGKLAGDTIVVVVVRGESHLHLRITLAPRPANLPPAPTTTPAPAPAPAGKAWLGAALVVRGGRLVIDEVDPRGPAAAAKLQKGDVLVSAGGRALRSLADFEAVFHPLAPGARLRVEVERDGWTKALEVPLTARP